MKSFGKSSYLHTVLVCCVAAVTIAVGEALNSYCWPEDAKLVRAVEYQNRSGEKISELTIRLGVQIHDLVNLPDGSVSKLHLTNTGSVQGEVRGRFQSGSTFRSRTFSLPVRGQGNRYLISVQPGGTVILSGGFD
ncbi:MAG: hypothetical protein KF752_03615 [Pirellulaceae bacterium]|nr:hypothetical protein [Pirellulaceae bacterium]